MMGAAGGFFRRALSAGGISPSNISLAQTPLATRDNSLRIFGTPTISTIAEAAAAAAATTEAVNSIPAASRRGDHRLNNPSATRKTFSVSFSSQQQHLPQQRSLESRRTRSTDFLIEAAVSAAAAPRSHSFASMQEPTKSPGGASPIAQTSMAGAASFINMKRRNKSSLRRQASSSRHEAAATEQQLRDASETVQTALNHFQLLQTFSIAHLDTVASTRQYRRQTIYRKQQFPSHTYQRSSSLGENLERVGAAPESIGPPSTETMMNDDEQLLTELFESEVNVLQALHRLQDALRSYDELQKRQEEHQRKRHGDVESADWSESRVDE
jgi:hypothetical protein